MRVAIGLALLLAGTAPVCAQMRRALICSEDLSLRLTEPAKPEVGKEAGKDPAATELPVERLPARTFSLTTNGDFLTLISAGKSDFYECQKVTPRLNEGRPRNAIKCQNGVYFLTIDLTRLRFVRAQLNPEDRTEVGFGTGSCRSM